MAAVTMMVVISGATASAQDDAARTARTYRARVGGEASTTRVNTASPFGGPSSGPLWDGSNQIVATGDGTWTPGERLHIGAGIAAAGAGGSDLSVRIRQAYARISVASWLDVEAGKRIVKWGTGYVFTPTGLLDPPRTVTDPQDRLGVNEGMALAQATMFRGDTAVTIAAAAPRAWRPTAAAQERLIALKVRTAIRGFEVALVASGASRRRIAAGANFTHVVGDRVEWHGEWLMHDRTSPWIERLDPRAAGARTMSALLGLQYTSASGVNVVLEGYRDGNGLDHAAWQRLIAGADPAAGDARHGLRQHDATPASDAGVAAGRPSRRDFVFVRAARASTDARWTPELMTIAGIDDGSVTIVPTSAWTVRPHVDVYIRAVALAGAGRSEARDAPLRAMVMLGVTVRY